MFHLRENMIARAIAARKRHDKRVFTIGAIAGGIGMLTVSRVLFKIKCRRCKKKNAAK